MRQMLLPLAALLLSTAVVLTGNGLLTVLIPVRARLEGFSDLSIGMLSSVYYAGILLGCFLCPHAIRRVGHIRAFTAFTAIAVAAPLLHAMSLAPAVWLGLRLLTGICFAGLTMGIESWLNEIATAESRGRILSLYTVLNFAVIIAGQQMLNAAPADGFELFSFVAILISLAAVPLALTRSAAPEPPQTVRLRPRWLYEISPVGVAGCVVAGIVGGAFWGLAPVAVLGAGLSVSGVALFMSAAVLGGAVAQWPLGWLSDRKGRRLVLIMTAVLAAATGLPLMFLGTLGFTGLIALAILYGAGMLPLYALAVAHANDFVERGEAVQASSGLLLIFSCGAVAGPALVAGVIEAFGGRALFAFTSAVLTLFAAFVSWRRGARPGLPPAETRRRFVSFPSTSQAVFRLFPRNRRAAAPADGEAPPPPSA